MTDRILLGIAVVILIFNYLINQWAFNTGPNSIGTFVALMLMIVVIANNIKSHKKEDKNN